MRLSILTLLYNERSTLERILAAVQRVPVEKEIIVVDDGSTDGSSELLEKFDGREGIRVLRHPENRGKGASLRRYDLRRR